MKRLINELLLDRLNTERACALLGPRQAGKSFILKQIIDKSEGVYLSLDDPIIREEIKHDPLNFLKSYYNSNKFLFIDEPAKVPSIFDAIKIIIDEKGSKPSKICIANSGNYLLLKRVKESLAGRISIIPLYPLSWYEMHQSKNKCGLFSIIEKSDLKETQKTGCDFTQINRMREKMLLWGGYPIPALSQDADFRIRWIRDYLTTYVFPIIIEQFSIRNLDAFEKFVRLIFLNSGNLLNKNRIAREAGISQPTVDNYLYQLKAMMLIITLEAYHRNPKKRLVKQNKIHAIDPLLLHHTFNTGFSLERSRELQNFGTIYESFICMEIHKTLFSSGIAFNSYYWRTQDGAEVDLIIEYRGNAVPFEIKSTTNLSRRDASGLVSFLSDNPHIKQGYIVYPGREIAEISPNIIAVPDWWLLGCYGETDVG